MMTTNLTLAEKLELEKVRHAAYREAQLLWRHLTVNIFNLDDAGLADQRDALLAHCKQVMAKHSKPAWK